MSVFTRIAKPYADIRELLVRYWKSYGGWPAILFSPYFHFSVLLGLSTFPYGFPENAPWWDLPLTVLPSLVGFSLGGYAIFLAFGDEKFKRLIAGQDEDGEPSPYLTINTTFLHFIMVQVVGLILAVAAKSTDVRPNGDIVDIAVYVFGVVSYIGFVYALFLALATTVALYRLVWLHDRHLAASHEGTEAGRKE